MTVPAGDPSHAREQVALRIDLAVLLSTYGNAVGDGDATGEGLRLFAQAAAAADGDAGATAAREASRALAAAADDAAADAAWPELEDAFHGAARWLWDVLAQRVLEQLGLTGNSLTGNSLTGNSLTENIGLSGNLGIAAGAGEPREAPGIWWVPTGELARFPLHAAGYHGPVDSAPRSVLSRVVSSYATSLTSLRQAVTSRAPEHPPDGAVPGVLAVAMPHTPALGPAGDLPSAMAEMAVVSRHFPMAVTLAGAGARRAATLAAIRSASIAHFGCHATIVPADPSRGRLLLHDGAIPITELQALPAWRRGLAFLSACDTASARGDIPDEFVHLASAFQVIGFEHVIGTAWQVPDDIALAVTEGFYAGVWDPAAGRNPEPAAALHASVATTLASDPLNPFPWAYVHHGADSTARLPGLPQAWLSGSQGDRKGRFCMSAGVSGEPGLRQATAHTA